jgi:hypothetical protein
MWIFVMVACTPVDAWETTTAACERSAAACEQQMVADFGVEPDYPADERALLLAATTELLTWDLGQWPPTSTEPEVQALALLLEDVPGDTTAQRSYNFVAAAVDRTVLGPEDADYSFQFILGEMSVRPGGFPYNTASALLHEASHSTVAPHQVCSDGYDCDRSWLSAYGVQAGITLLALENCEEESAGTLREMERPSCRTLEHTWEVVRDRVRPR